MIIGKLSVGLGSQMFQYAFARRTALANNTDLKFDRSDDKIDYGKTYIGIEVFNVAGSVATEKEIARFKKFERKKGKINFFHNLFADENKYFKNKKHTFDPACLNVGSDAYLEGFWLSEKYFKDIKDVLLKDFTPKATDEYYDKMLTEINSANAVSIHVRRGDYVTNPGVNKHHGVTGLDYYYQAMKLIEEKTKDPVYFIFSDDLDWVKSNLKTSRPVHYVQQTDPDRKSYQDMLLMSRCQHNITANSSFSWWGAWLNQNKNKIVCTPKKWYNDPNRDISDYIPESWIKL